MAAREAEIEATRLRLIAEEANKKKLEKKKGPAAKPPSAKKTKDKDQSSSPPPGESQCLFVQLYTRQNEKV